MRHFCTYFDSNYLLRGLTLYRSLMKTGCEFRLYVVALDETTLRTLTSLGLEHLEAIPLTELEAWAPSLLVAKANRRLIEYYFTLTPHLPLFFLERYPKLDLITYLDADLYFYSSPEPIFTEMGKCSILITPHRYPPHLKAQEIYGLYNVQYQSFRRDPIGLACLERWRDQCLEWCYDRVEDGKYGDQAYLDEWPMLYGVHLCILQHRGAGVAPWNWSNSTITRRGDEVQVGGDSLIFYHFHGIKIFSPWFISNGLLDWGMMPWRLMRWFYVGYLRELRSTRRLLTRNGIDVPMRDRFIRGGSIGMTTMKEVLRKAWGQATIG
ncbi:glycosyl transferase [Magnetovirga frankeli]|uniref:glycosyl transferase n=1 Tax=Magnetovirga frankeli TaxID=947516 RepID=UPI0012931196|nr:glycosyl transferase [gamma proteobacterium SS-5]